MKNEREKLRIPGKKPTAFLFLPQTAQKRRYCPINSHLYYYAGNNPVKYIDPDGETAIKYEIKIMQNYNGNIPHSNESFEGSGCTFATMTGIIDDYRSKSGMTAINWQEKINTRGLDAYFVSQNDMNNGSNGHVGDLKRDKFLGDFTDGKLKILSDRSGDEANSTLSKAIADSKEFYIAGRAKVEAGTHGKVEHEIGISGLIGNSVQEIGSSGYDAGRKYSTEGDVGKIRRVLVIGEEK